MKKLIIPVILLLLCPMAHAAERVESIDSLSVVYEKSDNVELFSNNSPNFDGDTGRLGRNNSKEAYVTFKIEEGIKEIKTTAYSDEEIDDTMIRLYTSVDNETFTEQKMYRSYEGTAKVGYQAFNLVAEIPDGTEYFKIEWQETEKYDFLPQVSSVSFSDEADTYSKEGLLFFEPFKDTSLMYYCPTNFRFEQAGTAATLQDEGRVMRVYDLKSSIKYKIRNPLKLDLMYFVMDGKGEVEVYASSYDGGYKQVTTEQTFPEHTYNNWSVVYLTSEDFLEGTEFIKLVCLKNDHATWPPMLGKMEVRY